MRLFVLSLNGSPHSDGNCAALLKYIGKILADNGAEYKIINVSEAVLSAKSPFCTACSSPCKGVCFKGTALETAFEDMIRADFIIAASPVYFGTVSAQLKALFDKSRAIRGKLTGKSGSAIAVGGARFGGQETTIKAVHDMLLVHGMSIVGDGSAESGAGHQGVCASAPASEDTFAFTRAEALAERIISLK